MLKLTGAIFILLAGGLIGFTKAAKYRLRPLQLRALQSSLLMLQTEISFGATPLPEAFSRIAGRSEPAVQALFQCAADRLNSREGLTTSEAWNETLSEWQSTVALSSGDIAILKELGGVLGTSHCQEQEKHLCLAREQLHHEELLAEQARSKNESFWKYSGVLTGLILVIILF